MPAFQDGLLRNPICVQHSTLCAPGDPSGRYLLPSASHITVFTSHLQAAVGAGGRRHRHVLWLARVSI